MRLLVTILCYVLLSACTSSAVNSNEETVAGEVSQPAASPTQVNLSCKTNADCTIKDVGNCCGYFPACVNTASPTFPEQVRAACAKEGTASICGFADISSCECVDSQCRAASADAPAAVN
ncbi:MAG: hypothetical protein ACT4NL_14785 [Pseudomarimonas sp.]